MIGQNSLPPEAWIFVVFGLLALVLLVLVRIVRMAARRVRRNRPVRIHPKLQKYAELGPAQRVELEQSAARIITTSSRSEIPGYVTIQQVEAVFVDGYRERNEAMLALKAEAGRKGANAIINVTHERTANNRCAASGDAVIVRRGGDEHESDPSIRL